MKKASLSVWRLILVSLFVLVSLSPSQVSLWKFGDGEITPVQVPLTSATPTELLNPLKTNINGMEFCINTDHEQTVIQSCNKTFANKYWLNPESWQVKQAFFADLNLDGQTEAVVLVRRPFKPWPVDEYMPNGGRINAFQDKSGYSFHLILLTWKDGRFKEAWAGSAMADPIRDLYAVDLDGDGTQELAALEYKYNGNKQDGSIVIWSWNGFGFSLDARLPGSFGSLKIIEADHQNWLIAQ